jgi:hypothetical protein
MTPRHKQRTRLVVPILVLSIALIYVPVNLRSTLAQGVPTSAVPMIGRLEVHQGKYIKVDQIDAESGYTILDGQVLETSECTTASVHLLPVGMVGSAVSEIGQVDLAANTKAVINYTAGKVKVMLERGCARVRMAPPIDTTIDTPDGYSMPATQRVASDLKRAEVCFPSNRREDYRPACVVPIVFGLGGAATLITLALVTPCNRGQDTSPAGPPGPCL